MVGLFQKVWIDSDLIFMANFSEVFKLAKTPVKETWYLRFLRIFLGLKDYDLESSQRCLVSNPNFGFNLNIPNLWLTSLSKRGSKIMVTLRFLSCESRNYLMLSSWFEPINSYEKNNSKLKFFIRHLQEVSFQWERHICLSFAFHKKRSQPTG